MSDCGPERFRITSKVIPEPFHSPETGPSPVPVSIDFEEA